MHRYLIQFNPRRTPHYFTDVLIVGAGLAGLRAALAIPENLEVLVVTKDEVQQSNSNYAQGGIAGVLDPEDCFENHVEDTLKAGAGHCNREVVEAVVREAPRSILAFASIRRSRRAGGAVKSETGFSRVNTWRYTGRFGSCAIGQLLSGTGAAATGSRTAAGPETGDATTTGTAGSVIAGSVISSGTYARRHEPGPPATASMCLRTRSRGAGGRALPTARNNTLSACAVGGVSRSTCAKK